MKTCPNCEAALKPVTMVSDKPVYFCETCQEYFEENNGQFTVTKYDNPVSTESDGNNAPESVPVNEPIIEAVPVKKQGQGESKAVPPEPETCPGFSTSAMVDKLILVLALGGIILMFWEKIKLWIQTITQKRESQNQESDGLQ